MGVIHEDESMKQYLAFQYCFCRQQVVARLLFRNKCSNNNKGRHKKYSMLKFLDGFLAKNYM